MFLLFSPTSLIIRSSNINDRTIIYIVPNVRNSLTSSLKPPMHIRYAIKYPEIDIWNPVILLLFVTFHFLIFVINGLFYYLSWYYLFYYFLLFSFIYIYIYYYSTLLRNRL